LLRRYAPRNDEGERRELPATGTAGGTTELVVDFGQP
jgi:hypothetical protein